MDDSLDASTSSVLNRLTLDLRGTRFVIERKTLMNLPESVLLCLFPNGLVLSRQQQGLGALGGEEGAEEDEDEEEVYMVDVSPSGCLLLLFLLYIYIISGTVSKGQISSVFT